MGQIFARNVVVRKSGGTELDTPQKKKYNDIYAKFVVIALVHLNQIQIPSNNIEK